MNCEQLGQLIGGFSLVTHCDVVRNNALRIATPFRYPNGSQIDLFVQEQSDQRARYVLSDFGQTTEYLLDISVKPWSTKRRQQIISDICHILAIEQEGGQLQITLSEDEMPLFPEALVRLAQACIRMSDLVNTQKLQPTRTFNDEFEEYIGSAIELPYEPNYTLRGIYNNEVKVDYFVTGRHVKSLVQTLATPNPVAAHAVANEMFRRWYDLGNHRTEFSFLSVYNSDTTVAKEDDLARLGDLSTVFAFPAQVDELEHALAA